MPRERAISMLSVSGSALAPTDRSGVVDPRVYPRGYTPVARRTNGQPSLQRGG